MAITKFTSIDGIAHPGDCVTNGHELIAFAFELLNYCNNFQMMRDLLINKHQRRSSICVCKYYFLASDRFANV